MSNLRKYRESLNISQTTLAKAVGCTQGAMSAYEEIMLALRFFFGVEEDENVNEIIGQDHDPIGTIAAALDDYRSVNGEETNV